MFTNLDNVVVRNVDMILMKMQESDFQFYLTGSRFFGRNNATSDYDFFIQKQPDSGFGNNVVECFLEDLGFYLVHGEGIYSDSNTAKVYRWQNPENISEAPWIDVQIVKNAVLKNQIQEKMKKSGNFPPVSKTQARKFWDLCFELAEM